MHLERLALTNYRNYKKVDISFEQGLQFLVGNNGAGKTNILESINILSSTRSFRGVSDNNLIKWGNHFYFIQGSFSENDNLSQFNISYQRGHKKKLKINNEKIKTAKDFFGKMKTVTFLPEDMLLISGYPVIRRRFLDNLASQMNLHEIIHFAGEKYLQSLINYYKILKQRNHLLKMKSKMIETYTDLFWKNAAFISLYRYYLLHNHLFPKIREILNNFNNFNLDIELSVNPNIFFSMDNIEFSNVEEIFRIISQYYKDQNEKLYSKEKIVGTTLYGPHRDDIIVTINNQKANNFLSQGQKRIISIAMKLAELQLINENHGHKPIVLIDDITNELDQEKTLQILDLISQTTQSFIATTDEEFCHRIGQKSELNYNIYKIENDEIIIP